MPKTNTSDYEKLEKQIRVVGDESGKKIIPYLESKGLGPSSQDPNYGPHTLLKLSYLNYYLGVFLRIAGHRKELGRFDNIVFIDAYAGSGIVRIEDTKYAILGSTILAATASSAKRQFDKIISIEIDPNRASVLQKRCELLGLSNVHVTEGDSNEVINFLPKKYDIGKKSIVMLFIDPEGMEPQFSQFLSLSQATDTVDIMLNATSGITRVNGRISKNITDKDYERMKKFNPRYEAGVDSLESLKEVFEHDFGKPKGNQVEIYRTGRALVYTLILRVRRTWNGSKWVEAMNEFGGYISSIDGFDALQALQIIKGDQRTLG